ncbi:helix-turn-helix domain-containing protein [Actinokineospora sp. HUAS TT18]|uniref:helix-turn-helix domain-containing protein n=1 Tax=Actinokineospora sp. HUAS TT18 TaxID=3447451 RepID=UPI003F5238E7
MTDVPSADPAAAEPFAETLRAAIHASGITLDRVAERLRERGTPVSLATLSYWQSGRSQPERAKSLAAVANLEALFGLPAGHLVRLLDEPKPRGRNVHRPLEPIDSVAPWADDEAYDRVVGGFDLSGDSHLSRLLVHDVVVIGADRTKILQRTRHVLRAEKDGVDRWIAVGWNEGKDEPSPDIVPLRNCRLGRVNRDERTGQVATELLFDHPLAKRETIVIEHDMTCPSPRPLAVDHERVGRFPVRDLLMEVRFDPAALPVRIARCYEIDGKERVKALTLDSTHTAHVLGMDLAPGRYGIRWSWGPSAERV